MKLTDVLFRFKKRLPRGDIWRGKERLYRKVTPLILAKKRAEYELEEQNMFYLRHPYMTLEQSIGHAKSFKHKEKFLEKHTTQKLENWKPHKLLGDSYGFLKISDSWE